MTKAVKIIGIASVIVLACILLRREQVWADAASNLVAVEQYTTQNAIHIFVRGSEQTDNISCQIGNVSGNEVGWHSLAQAEEKRETLILLDHSLSIKKRYQEQLEGIVLATMAHASENELFRIAVIGENVSYLSDYTCNFYTLKESVLGIEYLNCDLNLNGGLIEILEEWSHETQQWMFETGEAPYFRRIILLTDGEQSVESIQQSEDLNQALSEYSCPIDIFALSYDAKSEESVSLRTISKKSNGRFYTLNEVGILDMDLKPEKKELNPVIEEILSDRDILHIKVIPNLAIRNGNIMKARLRIMQNDEEEILLINLKLPFQAVENEPLIEEDGDSVEKEQEAEIEKRNRHAAEEKLQLEKAEAESLRATVERLEKKQQEENKKWIASVICVMFMVILLLSVFYQMFLWICRKRNLNVMNLNVMNQGDMSLKDMSLKDMSLKNMGLKDVELNDMELNGVNQTVMLKNEFMGKQRTFDSQTDGEETMLLFQSDDVYEISLTDQSNPANYFSFPLKDSVIIGRKSTDSNVVISYEPSISAKHCELFKKNNRFFIKDLESANGTRINGIKIVSETEICSGNLLRLGQLELKIGWCLNE